MKEEKKFNGAAAGYRRELDYLLGRGIKITVEDIRYERKGRWFHPEEIRETVEIDIQQPTLGALDLINFYLQDVELDEDRLTNSDTNPYPELRRLSRRNLHNMAMAVAVATLGRESFVKTRNGYKEDRRKVIKRAEWLTMNLTPDKLLEVAQAVSVMCNLSDFLNSIRLLRIAPDRIEAIVECTDPGAGAEV